jgi:hypothetical protein
MTKPTSKKNINVWETSEDDYNNQLRGQFSDEDLDLPIGLEEKIEKLMSFFDNHGINYDKYNPNDIPKLDFNKKEAYPNYEQYMHVPGQHDTKKWLQAVKTVYYKEKDGQNRVLAIRQATNGWNLMEVHDFLNWLKFYEEGNHLKYKKAQVWYENGNPGYFLHIKKDPPKEEQPAISGRDIDFARDEAANDIPASEKKKIIEKQRHKIIGRLDSAEKLLRSQDGQMFAGKELESLMEAIYNLKKKIQLVNKLSTSTKLYEDMIIREANGLHKKGFVKASDLLHSVAEETGAPAAKITDKSPPVASPAMPHDASGAPGGLPSVGPGMPQTPPDSAPNEMPPKPKAIDKFLENLDTGKITTKEDKNDNMDVEDDLEVHDELLVTEAQEVPPAPAKPKATVSPITNEAPKKPESDLEVNEEDAAKNKENPGPSAKDFDNMIDAAFANLTVDDVVVKLEDLAKIFKTREVPRQLSIVDMMLDSLGLASYFPSLSEATNKALESNNYISTRVEDIISKLRGAMQTKDIDLRGEEQETNPAVQNIKNVLKTNEDKEKTRKEQRKQQQDSELDNASKETPEVEINEDLAAPAPVAPKAPPAPAKPIA